MFSFPTLSLLTRAVDELFTSMFPAPTASLLSSHCDSHCSEAWKHWKLEVPHQSDPRPSLQPPSLDTIWLKLVVSTLLQASRELGCYSTTACLTHHYPSVLASPAPHVQECAPHRLEVSFTFIFSALVSWSGVGFHEGLNNEWTKWDGKTYSYMSHIYLCS